MTVANVFIVISVGILAYQALDVWFESREQKSEWAVKTAKPSMSKGLRDVTQQLGRLGFNQWILKRPKYRQKLDLLLLRSGNVFGWKAEDLLFYKELFLVLAGFILWYNDVTGIPYWIGGLFAGFWLPEFYVKTKVTARQAEIQRNLPGFVDLIALTLESGLDFLVGIERVVAKMKPNALRDELQSLVQENRLGTPRKEALQHLAFRTNLPDIQSLTSIVIQSEELGTSLAMVLRNFAEDMRSRRILRAEEVAGKAPVKLLMPMMIFFFPIVFVIIFGPLALNFLQNK